MSAIYAITHIDSGRCYIGSTTDYVSRCYQHRSHLRRGKHRNPRLQHAWNKHGALAFTFEIIERDVALPTLITREQFWLDSRKPDVYNVGDAADCPVRGRKAVFSADHLAKLSAANKARAGWKHSDEAKAIVSATNSGRKRTPEHREAIRQAQMGNKNCTGKTRPLDAVERTRIKNTGKKRSPEAIANLRAGRQRYLARMRGEAA